MTKVNALYVQQVAYEQLFMGLVLEGYDVAGGSVSGPLEIEERGVPGGERYLVELRVFELKEEK